MIINQIVVSNKISDEIKRIAKEQDKKESQVVAELLEEALKLTPKSDVEYMDYLETKLNSTKALLKRYDLIGNFEVVFEKLINRTVRKRYEIIKKQDK